MTKADKQLFNVGVDYAHELMNQKISLDEMLDEAQDGCYDLAQGKNRERDAEIIYNGVRSVLLRK